MILFWGLIILAIIVINILTALFCAFSAANWAEKRGIDDGCIFLATAYIVVIILFLFDFQILYSLDIIH